MNPSQPIALTGIHTNIGKTICAAVLTQAWQCDYWKPIQAGDLACSDSIRVRELLRNPHSQVMPEAFALHTAASPHVAAAIDGVNIELSDLTAPRRNHLLIETAGSVLSPVNARHTVADLLAFAHWPTILVVQHYLGSISHTLSAIEALQSRGVAILGLVINGAAHVESEAFICHYTQLPIVARVAQLPQLNAAAVTQAAQQINWNPWNTP
ncbi:MAG: dethiobiotin synthase [Formosimonas sp.]